MGRIINIPDIPTTTTFDGPLEVSVGRDTSSINKRLAGFEESALPNIENVTLEYRVPDGMVFIWHSGFGTSDGDCLFQVEVNGVLFNRKRNHQTNPDVDFHVGGPFRLDAGDLLVVKTTNRSAFGSTNSVDVFVYGHEFSE